MRILCVIDHFGSGGAQRQMVTLACALKERGHDVEFFIYFPQHSHFVEPVIANRIVVHEYSKGRGFSLQVVKRLSSLIRSGSYNIVLSYLGSPNVYAELSRALVRRTPLVVSERGSHFGDRSWAAAWIKRNLHRLADHIVVNSASHASWLRKNFPWMAGRLSVIYNGFNLQDFQAEPFVPRQPRDLRLIAVGRVEEGKNITTLIEALRLFSDAHGWLPQISWVGRRDAADRAYCQRVDAMLSALPDVQCVWRWLGERSDVPHLLGQHHALIHTTFHEGLPNAICEALAAARPVLASNVCDNPLLVSDGERGFLFDPKSPASIVASIERLMALSADDWVRMSKAARAYAETALSVGRLVEQYENLFVTLTALSAHE